MRLYHHDGEMRIQSVEETEKRWTVMVHGIEKEPAVLGLVRSDFRSFCSAKGDRVEQLSQLFPWHF